MRLPAAFTLSATLAALAMAPGIDLYIDPAGGSDVAGNGSAAAPWQTWNGGAYPYVSKLAYSHLRVHYTTATADTSIAGNYQVPFCTTIDITCPWADSGLGNRAVAAGSSSSVVVDSVGGLVVNGSEGSRLRWITSANGMAGQVYFVPRNTAAQFQGVGGIRAMAAAATTGDTFAIEYPSGGWAPAANFSIDASLPGSRLRFVGGFRITPSTTIIASFSGEVSASGLFCDNSGHTSSQFLFNSGSRIFLGFVDGSSSTSGNAYVSAIGSANNLGCYLKSGLFIGDSSVLTFRDVVCTRAIQNTAGVFNCMGLDIHGTTSLIGITLIACFADLQNVTQQGAGASVPILQLTESHANLNNVAFDTALAIDAIKLVGSGVLMANVTGVNATAGKFGVVMDVRSTVTSNGGNTVAGGGGAVQVGAAGAKAWGSGLSSDFSQASPLGAVARL